MVAKSTEGKLLITSKHQAPLRMADPEEKDIDILKVHTRVTLQDDMHVLVNFSPVLDLIVSLDTVCPIRSYWRRLEDSSGTSTEYSGPFFHVYMISLLG